MREGDWCGVYKIVHAGSGKVYVGSSVHVPNRWQTHKRELRRGLHHSKKLQRAWAKYGEAAFEFVALEVVMDRNDLIAAEQKWIDSLSAVSGFNIAPTAGKLPEVTQEARERLRVAMVGRKFSPETLRRMSEGQRARPPASAETKKRLSEAGMGRIVSTETRAKIAAAHRGMKGPPQSAQSIAAASARILGRIWTADEIARRMASRVANNNLRGYKHSGEALEKIRATSRGRVFSPASIAKRVAARAANKAARQAEPSFTQ